MRSPLLKMLLITLITALIVCFFPKPSTKNEETSSPPSREEKRDTTSYDLAAGSSVDTTNTDTRFTRYKNGVVHLHSPIKLSRQLHLEETSPSADLEIITQVLNGYRLIYKENPLGSENEEIIAALLGNNPKQIVFIDPKSPFLQQKQLVDRWGSPYRFHPLTSTIMDIRSLGPDKKLWTEDDLSLDVKEVEKELKLTVEKTQNLSE